MMTSIFHHRPPRWAVLPVLLTAMLIGPSVLIAQDGPPPALVRVAEVQQQELQERFSVVGRLQEVRRAVVAAEVEGKIIDVSVEQGDPVVGGETVLAKVDAVWTKLQRDAAAADVKSARATLDQSKLDLKYLEQLEQANSARQREVDDTRAQVEADTARLQSAQVELDRAEEMIERLTIRAPFDGVVIEKTVEEGQWVDQGDPVVTMISRGRIDAVVGVPEGLIPNVKMGDTIEIVVEPLKRSLGGKVVSITPLSSNAARTFPVKVRMDDQDGQLKAGMSVVARVPTVERAQYMTVPRSAVVRSPQGTVIWVPSSGGGQNGGQQGGNMPTAGMVGIRVLFGAGESFAVKAGPGNPPLEAGQPVIIEGMEALFPGRPLIVQQDQPNQTTNKQQARH